MKQNIWFRLWCLLAFTCLYSLWPSLSCCVQNLPARNRTRCIYLHGCAAVIKRFPPAGWWPISVLQKWCRANLAQSGSSATADRTSCTPHKWESLILRVGWVFPHAAQEPFLPLGKKAVRWPDSTQSTPLLDLLLSSWSLSLSPSRLSALPQLYTNTKIPAPPVCQARLISCR